MRCLIALMALVALALADTVMLKNGLSVHGKVVEEKGVVVVTSGDRTWRFDRDRVASIREGESAPEEYRRRSAALAASDAEGWFRLALWAKGNNLPQARDAFERVAGLDPDHRAARRELGYERVDGEWVSGSDIKRAKGFVLCGGKWMLPAEADRLMRAGLMEQAKSTEEHRQRAIELVRAMSDDDPEIRKVAAAQLRELPDAALVRPLEKALYAPDPAMRIVAVKALSRIGDRVALPWLIRSSMYDAKEEVRNAAYRAIKGFRDADVFFPYARALFSKHPRSRIMAAKALADLDDLRGVDVVLRRISIGIGRSPRVNVMFGSQSSYIQDFDVEIAQAAAIGDPIVRTIREGVILDYQVLGGWGEAWVVEERKAYRGALMSLTGRDYGEDWKKYAAYAAEQDYPRVRIR